MRSILIWLALLGAGAGPACVHAAEKEGFIAGAKGTLTFRNVYFNEAYREGVVDRKEWAQGTLLNWSSGWTPGTVNVGMDVLGLSGVQLDSSRTHSGTGLLKRDAQGRAEAAYGSLGATASLRWEGLVVKAGTLLPKVPVVVFNHGRLLPQTYRGVNVTHRVSERIQWEAAYLDAFKPRDGTSYVRIIPQGYSGHHGSSFMYAGATLALTPRSKLTLYQGVLKDFYQQRFLGWEHRAELGPGTVKLDLRAFDSRDHGNAWAGEVNNTLMNGIATYMRGPQAWSVGYQRSEGQTAYPYVSIAVVDSFSNAGVGKFIQPGERTWMLRYDVDLEHAGLPGLSVMMRYYWADHAHVRGGERSEYEADAYIRYAVRRGWASGLGLEARFIRYRSEYQTDRDNVRLFMTYQRKF